MAALICTEEYMLIPAMIRFRGMLLANRVHGKPTWRDTLTLMEGDISTRVMYLARISGGLALTATDSEFVDFIKVFGIDALIPGEYTGAHLTMRNITLEDAEYFGILEDGRMIAIVFRNKTLIIKVYDKDEWNVEGEQDFLGILDILGIELSTNKFKMALLMESIPLAVHMYQLEDDTLTSAKSPFTEHECRELMSNLDSILETLK